jgi:ribosome-binding factor A
MLRHALSDAIGRGDLRDPDLVDVVVTVTEVRVSPDLKNATAYVLPLGGDDAALVVAALNRAAAFLRRAVAGNVTLKYLPAFAFEADTSFDQASRIDRLLRDATGESEQGSGDGS